MLYLHTRAPGLLTATAGPGKPFSRGLNSVGAEIETPKASRGRKHGRGVPSPSHRVCLGSVVSFPPGPGRSQAGKWISWIFDFRKKPSETPLSVILSGGGAPKRRGAWENSQLFPRLDGPVFGFHRHRMFRTVIVFLFHRLPHSCSGRNSGVWRCSLWSRSN